MRQLVLFALFFSTLLMSSCADMGYNQPVYIISDTSLEEDQKETKQKEEHGIY